MIVKGRFILEFAIRKKKEQSYKLIKYSPIIYFYEFHEEGPVQHKNARTYSKPGKIEISLLVISL